MIVLCDPRVPPWVAQQSGGDRAGAPVLAPSVGLADAAGHLVAGSYLSWVTDTNAWCHIAGRYSRGMLRAGLALYFDTLGLQRLSFLLLDNQHAAMRLVRFLGAKPEHVINRGHAGGDAILFALWRNERTI